MPITLSPPYEDLTFMAALSSERADRLVRFVADGLQGTIIDVGCGWAELLLRVVSAAGQCHGIGVDLDQEAISHAGRLAGDRGLVDRLTLVAGDARDAAPDHAEAVICIGSSHIWGPHTEQPEPLDYGAALGAIRGRVSRGARVIFGEAIWSRPPTPAAAAPLGGRLDEFVPLAELVQIAVENGLVPMAFHEASLDEWDEFESGYGACYARWLAQHAADHPDAEEVRERARRQRDGYLSGYRGVLGMGYLELEAV